MENRCSYDSYARKVKNPKKKFPPPKQQQQQKTTTTKNKQKKTKKTNKNNKFSPSRLFTDLYAGKRSRTSQYIELSQHSNITTMHEYQEFGRTPYTGMNRLSHRPYYKSISRYLCNKKYFRIKSGM